MLRFKLLPLSVHEFQSELIKDEPLEDLVSRIKSDYKLPDELDPNIVVYIDGIKIDRDKWVNISIGNTDIDVFVAIVPRGGDFRETARLIIITSAIIGGAVVGGPIGGATGAAVGGAIGGLAGTLLTNALLPPIVRNPTLGGIGAAEITESQMYSLQAQGNSVKKYSGVPRVYGVHRMYPNVVANPYTELETDPATGELSQYLYAIFDFGFGPNYVTDIRIGDNPLWNYTEVTARLVDLNRPAVSEGVWDDQCYDSFTLYKGDRESDKLNIPINANEDQGGPASEYQVTRDVPGTADGSEQLITVDMYAPQGLNSYATTGNRGYVNVRLKVEYAEIGTEDWKNYNDPTVTRESSYAGGSEGAQQVTDLSVESSLTLLNPGNPSNVHPGLQYFKILNTVSRYPGYIGDPSTSPFRYPGPDTAYTTNNINVILTHFYSSVGYRAGDTSITIGDNVAVGSTIKFGEEILGVVASTTPTVGGRTIVTFVDPLPRDIALFQAHFVYLTGNYSPLNTGWNVIYDNPLPTYGYTWGSNISVIDNSRFSNYYNTFIKAYFPLFGELDFLGNSQNQLFFNVKFIPIDSTKQYKVRVTRVSTTPQYTFQITDKVSWLNLSVRFDRTPVITPYRHTFLELRIKATNQINGTLDVVSGVVQSVLEVFDGANWNKELTSNPAWVFSDILTGAINKRPIDKSRLDTASLLEWAAFCDETPPVAPGFDYSQPRFQSNFILDFPITVQDLINKVTNMCQASMNVYDGKYGVLIDKNKTTPVQMFTQRNSWGFSSNISYTELPHALRVKFVDPESSWEINTVNIYNTGYDKNTATLFEDLDTFGITNFEQAGRYGRYMLAQSKLRRELITIEVDFENLICTRGDYVIFAHDVMRAGGTPARVRSVAGNQITIDDGIVVVAGSYGYTYRGADGTFNTSTLTIVNSKTFDLDGAIPAVGDLILIGLVDQTYIDCIVKTIEPGDDFTATLTLVEKAPAIYDSESEDPPEYTPNLAPDVTSDEAAPGEVANLAVTENFYDCTGNGYEYFIRLSWDAPTTGAFELFEIYVNNGDGYGLYDFSSINNYKFIVNEDNLGIEHKFKILAVSATGKKLNLTAISQEVAATPVAKSTPPSDVDGLFINITGEVLQLNWAAIEDCDVSEYLIRFVPLIVGATWESSSPLLRVDRNTTLASVQARVGTYLIKAVDFNQNESLTAARAITSIPNLFNLNVIDTKTDFPTLLGNKDRVEVFGDSLILKTLVATPPEQYYSEGYYYFSEFLDLGEVYTVRLQALIEAEGYAPSDLMSNWVTLDAVEAMSNSSFSDWSADLEFRTTANLNVMSEWTSLEDVIAMSSGDEDIWTEWKEFTIGDFTGRIFQFRLKLTSITPYYTPRVYAASVKADMADRIESYSNLTAPDTGLTVTYTPAFKGPGTTPAIGITQDGASQGDYYLITSKTLESFTIRFYDKNDNPVSRQFDAMVKGYGRKHTEVVG